MKTETTRRFRAKGTMFTFVEAYPSPDYCTPEGGVVREYRLRAEWHPAPEEEGLGCWTYVVALDQHIMEGEAYYDKEDYLESVEAMAVRNVMLKALRGDPQE